MIKFMFLGSRARGRTRAGALRHLAQVHGRMVVSPPSDAGQMPRRYVQHHVIDGAYPGSAAYAAERDLVTELWFDDMAQLQAATSTDYYRDRLQPDEADFVDTASVVRLRVVPQAIGGQAEENFKAFMLLTPVSGLASEKLVEAVVGEFTKGNFSSIISNQVLAPPGAGEPFVTQVLEGVHPDREAVLKLIDRVASTSFASMIDLPRSLALATEVFTSDRLRTL